MPVNIKAVADKAGVSVATVSRVMNHPELVTEDTREHILSVMKKMNYTPNWFARNIQSTRTGMIGLLVHDFLDTSNMEIAKGVEAIAHQKGYHVMLCNTEFNPVKEKEYIDTLIERKIDGLILTSTTLRNSDLDKLKQKGANYVLVGKNKNINRQNIVYTDYRTATEEAIRYLITMGRNRIGLVLGEYPKPEVEEKLEGYKRALRDGNLPFDEHLVYEGENSLEGGFLAASKILEDRTEMDAIFASTDQMALGVMDKLKSAGVRIPEDIALIGFDDLRIGALVEPKLTTISKPTYRMGLMAARLLFDIIEGDGNGEAQEIALQSKLKIRRSCGNKGRLKEIW